MSRIVQVYTEKITPRLKYSLDLVFTTILDIEYILTESPDPDQPLVNYSFDRSVGGIFIQPDGLLFETGIRKQDIWVAHSEGLPMFFQQPPEAGFIMDIFSFAFYLVSRYEEYLPYTRDEHGRFAAESSLAYKHNFLDLPVVDLWVLKFGERLSLLYPKLKIEAPVYSSLLTVDVDVPFAYRGKGLIRNIGGMVRDSFTGISMVERYRCMLKKDKDPYDTFSFLNSVADEAGVPVKYFFTTGNRSSFDKNPLPSRPCYRKLIRKLASKYEIGLHPSYRSDRDVSLARKEQLRLEKVSGMQINSIRKHYLLMSFPKTYQDYIELGISNDYTLGYAREAGFRAGIARPFFFYDLELERISDLRLHPFQYMDNTLKQYKRFTHSEALEHITHLVDQTRRVGGTFISLWHNTSLAERDGWEGWTDVYRKAIKHQAGLEIIEK